MAVPASHFEAKKHAYRQTQDGVVISFVVHPNDLNAALAVAPLGTRYMVAVAEIGDDGQPVPPGAPREAGTVSPATAAPPPPQEPRGAPGEQTKGGWYGLLPSARMAILVKDQDFRDWAAEAFKIDHLLSAEEAELWLKDRIDTPKKSYLNPDHKPHFAVALRKFQSIERSYRISRGLETAEMS